MFIKTDYGTLYNASAFVAFKVNGLFIEAYTVLPGLDTEAHDMIYTNQDADGEVEDSNDGCARTERVYEEFCIEMAQGLRVVDMKKVAERVK